eukprot:TRINITY_DN3774_c0_g2_i11.p1 TRINITY_DN3774_c0_g2~~TRINITY_DN3774_c0_g2_i11.p1  ORF type:complete len:463 (+),score=92.05 TRINITY_DN3774_c0_g2_i11:459-1847(+)
MSPIQEYTNYYLVPAKEARRKWQNVRNQLNSANIKVDHSIELCKHISPNTNNVAKGMLVRQLFCAQELQIQAASKEQVHYEDTIERMFLAVCNRDPGYLSAHAHSVAELHDTYLECFAVSEQAMPQLEQVRNEVEVGLTECNERSRKRESRQEERDKLVEERKFEPLVKMLSAEDLALISAIGACAGSDQSEMLRSVIMILDAHKETRRLIKLGIIAEVNQTVDAATLFRGNTVSTKMMTAFTKMTGAKYLQVIKKPVEEVITNPCCYEIDLEKIPLHESLEVNKEKLTQTCQFFLDSILNSLPECPFPFHEIAFTLQQEVTKKFPNSKHSSIGGFIFLRFFCPAISSPETHQVSTTTLTKESRRALVLVSKVLQTLSNGLNFGNKEGYLVCMNEFIANNMERTRQFLEDIAVCLFSPPPPVTCGRKKKQIFLLFFFSSPPLPFPPPPPRWSQNQIMNRCVL